MLAFRLIPKEEKFFEDFVAMAEQIHRGAILLEQMLAVPDRPLTASLRRFAVCARTM